MEGPYEQERVKTDKQFGIALALFGKPSVGDDQYSFRTLEEGIWMCRAKSEGIAHYLHYYAAPSDEDRMVVLSRRSDLTQSDLQKIWSAYQAAYAEREGNVVV